VQLIGHSLLTLPVGESKHRNVEPGTSLADLLRNQVGEELYIVLVGKAGAGVDL
jgi:hypothetical protein